MVKYAPLLPEISPLNFLLWDLLEEHIYADYPKTIKELTDITVSVPGHLLHKWPTRPLRTRGQSVRRGDPTQERSIGDICRERCRWQVRVGVTGVIVDLFGHFIGNKITPRFWKCDIQHER